MTFDDISQAVRRATGHLENVAVEGGGLSALEVRPQALDLIHQELRQAVRLEIESRSLNPEVCRLLDLCYESIR